jgi:formin-binding protein 1
MLLNSLQDLSELRTHKLNILWTHASNLEQTCLSRTTKILQHSSSEISRNVPVLDSTMFARHNNEAWTEPADFEFEPSPIWHDDPTIVTNEVAKVFLRNIVSKSREGLNKIKANVALKQQEVDKLRASIQGGQDKEAVNTVFLHPSPSFPGQCRLLIGIGTSRSPKSTGTGRK